ncbi:MAG TPA: di-heme oxidoredictase family protein [Candidatus Eisenbacteria bacterium]|nr:di-heme oxidoredictase family protein [Candidatus Eisenbacteria bacterium]
MNASMVVKRFLRWLLFTLPLGAILFAIAGRLDLPMVWAFFALLSALTLMAVLIVDEEMARERMRRDQRGEDPVRLLLIRLLFLATFVIALLDVGRFHWSDTVPRPLQWAALAVVAASFLWTLLSVRANRFFVPVVRIQSDRGHRVVDAGPYAHVRHPGYLGMVLGAPACPLALGSWLALVPATMVAILFLRRTSHEDRFLRQHLDGYEDYSRRVRYRLLPGVWSWILVGAALLNACGTLMTTAPDPGDVMDGPLDGLTKEELAAFATGDAQFGKPFAIADGLGPIFNNVSCAACHSGDGRGRPENMLTRFSMGGDPVHHMGGPQLQERAIPGAYAEQLPGGVEWSRRLPPPVFGVGLIEAIPVADVLAHADEADANGDGISGRPNWVQPAEFVPAHEPGGGTGPQLGRFSRKAQVSSLIEQTVAAYAEDIGITSDFRTVENYDPLASPANAAADRVSDPELPAADVIAVVTYLRLLAPPAPGAMNASRERGRTVFASVGCASCHVPVLRTGPSKIRALANRDVALYSDLLLHDMGDGLADYRPDGSADGREWRTTPLWGLRVMREFLNGEAFLLHDGRARSVDQAIRLHGGEAQAARDGFIALPESDRKALLDFVESR